MINGTAAMTVPNAIGCANPGPSDHSHGSGRLRAIRTRAGTVSRLRLPRRRGQGLGCRGGPSARR
jgi:hypothetical protein